MSKKQKQMPPAGTTFEERFQQSHQWVDQDVPIHDPGRKIPRPMTDKEMRSVKTKGCQPRMDMDSDLGA